MDILIKDGTIVTLDPERRILKDSCVAIEDGRITEIAEDIKGDADFAVDAKGNIVMPGLVNTHTHLAMTLLRGVADDLPLMTWLEDEIWPLEAQLTPQHIYGGSLLGCLEMITSGTTCFSDMYFHLDEVARSIEESGMRGVLSAAMFDLIIKTGVEETMKEGRSKIGQHHNTADERIKVFFGPHAPYTCSEELLIKTKEEAAELDTGIHIHVSETEFEVDTSKKEKGLPPFEYLDKIGFLGPEVVSAHSVWPTEKEMGIIKERGVKISHNPISNMKIAAGVAPVPTYLERGIEVSLGTDGAASNNTLDMFETMKMTALLHKVFGGDASTVPAQSVLEMATINGAKALGMGDSIGSLEPGKKADVIIVDVHTPNLTPFTNPVSHLVYAASGSDVDTVIVDGRMVMENRQMRTLDPKDTMKFATEQARDLLEKGGKEGRMI
jgi:5-methylthioadenosine/S-adenosylhomocysteine deaminase